MLAIDQIQFQLRRAAHLETVNDARNELNKLVHKLAAGVALEVLGVLLDPKAQLAKDFVHRLDHAIRLELLLGLQFQLERARALRLYEDLTVTAGGRDAPDEDDLKLQDGLAAMFPRPDQGDARAQFLKALRAPLPTDPPTILLMFRNKHTFSPDNLCDVVTKSGWAPVTLGPDPQTGNNWMEVQGTVNGYQAGVHQFAFDQTIEMKTWFRVGDTWKTEQHLPPGTNDNKGNWDKWLWPSPAPHIYVVDGPGVNNLGSAPNQVPREATEYVQMMNAENQAQVGRWGAAPLPTVATIQWYSVTWLERDNGGRRWRRMAGRNKIALGSIPDLDSAEPPITHW
jgi:hypothetical protein